MFSRHPLLFFTAAFYLTSAFVDALKMCPPKPEDGRRYLFIYTFLMALAGNLNTLLESLTQFGKHPK